MALTIHLCWLRPFISSEESCIQLEASAIFLYCWIEWFGYIFPPIFCNNAQSLRVVCYWIWETDTSVDQRSTLMPPDVMEYLTWKDVIAYNSLDSNVGWTEVKPAVCVSSLLCLVFPPGPLLSHCHTLIVSLALFSQNP